jgi:hypothetical protein
MLSFLCQNHHFVLYSQNLPCSREDPRSGVLHQMVGNAVAQGNVRGSETVLVGSKFRFSSSAYMYFDPIKIKTPDPERTRQLQRDMSPGRRSV